jgi:hypothetical protein
MPVTIPFNYLAFNPDTFDEFFGNNFAVNANVTVYTAPSDKIAYITDIGFSIVFQVAGSGTAFIIIYNADAVEVNKYRLYTSFNVPISQILGFYYPIKLSPGWKIVISSNSVNMLIALTVHGYVES